MNGSKNFGGRLQVPDDNRLGREDCDHLVDELDNLLLLDWECLLSGLWFLTLLWLKEHFDKVREERIVWVLLHQWRFHICAELLGLLLQLVDTNLADQA